MKLSMNLFATMMLFVVLAGVFAVGEEDGCPAFDSFVPSCLECIQADCGFTKAGDCLADCATVTNNTKCYSIAVSGEENATEYCAYRRDSEFVLDVASDAQASGNPFPGSSAAGMSMVLASLLVIMGSSLLMV